MAMAVVHSDHDGTLGQRSRSKETSMVLSLTACDVRYVAVALQELSKLSRPQVLLPSAFVQPVQLECTSTTLRLGQSGRITCMS